MQSSESTKMLTKNSLFGKAYEKRRDNNFPEQKLRKSITVRPTLQEILRGVLSVKESMLIDIIKIQDSCMLLTGNV